MSDIIEKKLGYMGYGIDWSFDSKQICIGSVKEGDDKIELYEVDGLKLKSSLKVPFPPTKILFKPGQALTEQSQLLATSSDMVRIYQLNSDNKLELINELTKKSIPLRAPLTCMDWSFNDPSLLITGSIDTTCTLWDVKVMRPVTQLIAHDSEVYDVQFVDKNSPHKFGTAGKDGSIRLFDLRSLAQSTIVYECNTNQYDPIYQLKFNPSDPNYLAILSTNKDITILDIRMPSVKVIGLTNSNNSKPKCIDWHPNSKNYLASGNNDGLTLYDLSMAKPTLDKNTYQFQTSPQYQYPIDSVNSLKFHFNNLAILSKDNLSILPIY